MIGICGNEKDSDVIVTVDLNATERNIQIESKLKKMFGKLMVASINEVLDEMEVANANVRLQDFGALDFVIKARTRTAVRRALAGGETK